MRNASPLIVKGMELKSQKCVKDFNHTHVLLCVVKVLLSQNFGQPKKNKNNINFMLETDFDIMIILLYLYKFGKGCHGNWTKIFLAFFYPE